jgi:hypothetical protein
MMWAMKLMAKVVGITDQANAIWNLPNVVWRILALI